MPSTPDENRSLNAEQKKAVTFGRGPLLIIAGAGSGKTTVVTERIKYLISSGKAAPSEILALTFTEKASREMEERVDRAMPLGVTQMWISTFHSFCDRVLKSDALSIGIDPGYRLMTDAETIQFFRANIFAFPLSMFRPLGNPTKFVSAMSQHFSRLKDEDVTPVQYREWAAGLAAKADSDEDREEAARYGELSEAYRVYEELKVKNGVADYSDLISNTLKLFRARPGILKRYQEQFKYVLIDEFQDTNFAQNELAVLLAGPRRNITVVGDDDQAIYRFRGAAVSNIIQFRTRFPKAKAVVLTKNYRSTKEVLDRSYDLVQHNNPDRLEVVEKIDKRLECMRRVKGDPVRLLYAERVEDEADLVAGEIRKLTGPGARHPVPYGDVAVLVRANAHAEPFVRAFIRHGIPYQFLGPGQLFRQPEVKDLVAYLTLLADITDSTACYRVLSMDHFRIQPRDVAAMVSSARLNGISLFEACEQLTGSGPQPGQSVKRPFVTGDGEKKIGAFTAMVHKHLALIPKETAGQILYYFMQDTGLLAQYSSVSTAKEEKEAGNIAKLFDKLKTYEVDHEDASVHAVVEWIQLSMNLGESPMAADTDWSGKNAVSILTVHSSKGLEFPVVFLVNLVSQRFPSTERREQLPIPEALVKEVLPEGDFHLEEERRLFYVGMTRARDRLYLTAAKYYGEGKRDRKLSPFVAEALGTDTAGTPPVPAGEGNQQLFLIDWVKLEEPETPRTVSPVAYLSYSQYETFKTCPRQYKYRYVVRIPVPPSAALSFGDTVHRTLKQLYDAVKEGNPVTETDVLSWYDRNWANSGFRNRDYELKMKDHGRQILSDYFRNHFDRSVVPIALESPFRIKIGGFLTLGGKIDRVDDLGGGKIEIIDYKTGTSTKKRDPAKDEQLSVYALAATDPSMFGKRPEDVTVSLYFLEGNEKVSGTRTAEQLAAMKDAIAVQAEKISTSPFEAAPGMHCDFCEFRLICDAWK